MKKLSTFSWIFFLFLLTPRQYVHAQTQANFVEMAEAMGLNNAGRNSGIAVADFNNDDLDDIYVSQSNGTNLLYEAQPDGRFVEIGAQAGVAHTGTTTQSIWGDIDNDGDLDLFLGNRMEPNKLYLNQGNGTFVDISASAGVNKMGLTKAAMFGDIDNDGFIDLYVANLGTQNEMYRNNGNLTFTDITFLSGATDTQIAMGALFFDYDNDNDLDLYLTHDANQPNILYQNDGSGHFIDVSAATNTNHGGQGMGVDFGDVNNDGHLDLYITNLYENTLLLNNGNGSFSNISAFAGVTDLGMGWGTLWFDYDNDGWQDIYVANDSYFSPFANILYKNMGDLTFQIVSDSTVLSSMFGGYGVASLDNDMDGWLDLYLANNGGGGNDENQYFNNQNQTPDHHWVKVKTTGTISNKAGIGARVTLEVGDHILVDEVCAGSGYASQNSLTLHFGLGLATTIDRMTVRWSAGTEEVFENLAVDRLYQVIEMEGMVTNTEDVSPFLGPTLMPNPFVRTTTIQFELAQQEKVEIGIFTLTGQKINTIFQGDLPPGRHQFSWDSDGIDHPAGVYICQLKTDTAYRNLRMVKQ